VDIGGPCRAGDREGVWQVCGAAGSCVVVVCLDIAHPGAIAGRRIIIAIRKYPAIFRVF
jgi:hypothetical protein